MLALIRRLSRSMRHSGAMFCAELLNGPKGRNNAE